MIHLLKYTFGIINLFCLNFLHWIYPFQEVIQTQAVSLLGRTKTIERSLLHQDDFFLFTFYWSSILRVIIFFVWNLLTPTSSCRRRKHLYAEGKKTAERSFVPLDDFFLFTCFGSFLHVINFLSLNLLAPTASCRRRKHLYPEGRKDSGEILRTSEWHFLKKTAERSFVPLDDLFLFYLLLKYSCNKFFCLESPHP